MFEKLTEVRLHFPKPIHIIKKPKNMRRLDTEDSILLFFIYFLFFEAFVARENEL